MWVLAVAAVAVALSNGAASGNADIRGALAQALVPAVALAGVGALIASRVPRSPIGWLLLAGAVTGVVPGVLTQYELHTLVVAKGSLPGADWAAWTSNFFGSFQFPGIVTLILLLFPDGRLLSARWRAVLWATVANSAANVIIGFLDAAPIQVVAGGPSVPNPLLLAHLHGIEMGPVGYVLFIGGMATVLLAALSLLLRMRRREGLEREQVRWVLYPLGLGVSISIAYTVIGLVIPAVQVNLVNNAIVTLCFGVGFPAAVAIAILRYRLYDIDVVISRTLVYGSLAALITGVYVGIAVGIGELVGSGGRPNLGLSIVATAIVAIGFQPVRERLQRIANRLVYGRRATPYQVLSEFSSQVAGSYAADEVLPRMARVLQEGTGAEAATVWLRGGDLLQPVASHPEDRDGEAALAVNGELPVVPGVTRAVEVRHQGELLGALSVVKRRSEALTPVEEKLLDDLAQQAGLVLKNVRLTADLQRRLEELRASRQRLVAAQDAERRRLERNLHDGAQQHLVALKVKLGLAEMLAARDPEKAKATIEQLKGDADEALETLRDLARGIYPPLLAEKGLAVALESQAGKATVPVRVVAEGIGRYSQDVEATVYFCVLEALQNIQKYAEAASATVRLHDADGVLHFEVEDDGCGFDPTTTPKGSGLTNMRDRVDALAGTVEVASTPGQGTRLSGALPLAETARAWT